MEEQLKHPMMLRTLPVLLALAAVLATAAHAQDRLKLMPGFDNLHEGRASSCRPRVR